MPDKIDRLTTKEIVLLEKAEPSSVSKHDPIFEALSLLDHLEKQKNKLEQRERVEERYSFGERIADRVAEFGGSWAFIISFVVVLIVWIALNVSVLFGVWDPFPFILLNLVLSCIAALQAPVILMSQNRQASRDRYRDEIDFERDRLDLKVDTLAAKTVHEATLRIKNIEGDLALINKKLDALSQARGSSVKKGQKKTGKKR